MNNILNYLEKTAEKFPDKTAVALDENKYTFCELVNLSKRIGYTVKKRGLKNHAIGVIADRGIETLAFFMGAVYSGNFYVPIDPTMPKEKKTAIISDADISVMLGIKENKKLFEELQIDGEYLSLEDIGDGSCDIPETVDGAPLYMVYTSGSTGKPKGVLKSHTAEISYIDAYCETFDFSSDEIIGNQTPFYFDASGKDIYMMVKLGCTIEIIPTMLFSFPPQLMEFLNAKKITFVSWVPTALSLVAQMNPFSVIKPQTLKKVFFVGEVMPMKHLNKWREALPHIQYVNLYGQSEIAGICCYYEVKGEFENTAVLPMGLPLKNCKIYLLDNENIITKPDKIGEMYLVSDALATEYYGDKEKTDACFTYRDFGEGPVRCFKTGDLAQYDKDGNLIFASRTDFQIKHMGQRIELGEIEAIAGSLNEIGRCCCLYNSDKKKIVLFCELSDGVTMEGREIQSILRDKLSSYMVPGKVNIMENLPLNANGKIDRQKLKSLL